MAENIVSSTFKTGLIEYMQSILPLYEPFVKNIENNPIAISVKNIFSAIENLLRITYNTNNIDDLINIKKSLASLESSLNYEIKEIKKESLSSREKALIERGYDVDDVIRLCSYTDEEIKNAAEVIFERITEGCKSVENPQCIFLGGQPGCGKSTTSMRIKSIYDENGIVEIGIDNYRTYHPKYEEMEALIRKHWEGKTPDENHSPGNDIADFTHKFAGHMTDILQEMVSNNRFNISMEWAMRESKGPLKTMKDLKNKGYRNIVSYIAVNEEVSLKACDIRANVMNGQQHIIRRVPKSFHSLAVSTLPQASNEIYEQGYQKDKTIDQMYISNRNGEILWDAKNMSKPGQFYSELLHNPQYALDVINNEEYAKLAYISEAYGFEQELNTRNK